MLAPPSLLGDDIAGKLALIKLTQGWPPIAAGRLGHAAAINEDTMPGRCTQLRLDAGNGPQRPAMTFTARHGIEQCGSIGMLRPRENSLAAALLNDPPRIHHGNAPAILSHSV